MNYSKKVKIIECNRVEINDGVEYKTIKVFGRGGLITTIEIHNARLKGEWTEHYSKEMSEKGYFLCSRCKCGFQRFERGVRHSDLPWIDGQKYELHCIDNFCPNCGADMRGEGV